MAEDWIKMRTHLYSDPKVSLMADLVFAGDGELAGYVNQHNQCDMSVTRNVTRNAIVGALVAVWGVCRKQGAREGADLVVKTCDMDALDDIANLPGFGSAMCAVGWCIDNDGSIVLPRFYEEHNVDPKEANARRQREFRERRKEQKQGRNARNVTRNVTRNDREEKRREDITDTPNGVSGGDPSGGEDQEPVLIFPCVGNGPKVWSLYESKVSEWSTSYPGVDVLGECRKALQWLRDNPQRSKTYRGMPAFLSRWLSREQDHSTKGSTNGGTRTNGGVGSPDPTRVKGAGTAADFANIPVRRLG